MDLYLVYLNFSDTTLFSLKWVGDYVWEATFFWVFVGHYGFFVADKIYIRKLWSLGRRLLQTWGNFKFFYFVLYLLLLVYFYIFVYFFQTESYLLYGSLLNLIVLVIELILLIFIINYYSITLNIVDIAKQVSFISYKRIQVILRLKNSLVFELLLLLKFHPFKFELYLSTLCYYFERLFLGFLDPDFILSLSTNYPSSTAIETYFLLKKYFFLFFSKALPSFSTVLKMFFNEWFNLVYVESFKEENLKDDIVYLSKIKVSRFNLNLVDNVFEKDICHSYLLRDFLNFLFLSILYVNYMFISEICLIWKSFFIYGLKFYEISKISFPYFSWVLYLDSISFIFIFLLSLLIPICVLLHFWVEFKALLDQHEYITFSRSLSNNLYYLVMLYSLVLILCIVFLTRDLFIFYIMFEMSMLPLLFIILQYGSRINKIKATKYYFFYTLVGSFFFLVALFLITDIAGTTDLLLLKRIFFPIGNSFVLKLIWINLFIPFAIKIPIVPFHSWLPEAHVEAPTEGSVLLAGILLKVGAYGIIRFLFDLLPSVSLFFSPFILLLVSISILYSTFILFRQVDLKKIIAYFSIIHMNFALLGLFTFTHNGITGAIFIFFIHGLVSSGLFICVGFLYQRFHTRNYLSYSGLFTIFPVFTFLFFLLILSNFAFPGTAPFVGELLILLALFKKSFFLGFIALISVFSSAVFSLLIFTKMFFGIFRFNIYYKIYNYYLYFFEYFILFYLVFFIGFFGLVPGLITDLCIGMIL